jgi:hypothetical protein
VIQQREDGILLSKKRQELDRCGDMGAVQLKRSSKRYNRVRRGLAGKVLDVRAMVELHQQTGKDRVAHERGGIGEP